MKALFGVWVVVLILGIVSLFVPIPNREKSATDVSAGVRTEHHEKAAPALSAAMILGAAAMLVGARWWRT